MGKWGKRPGLRPIHAVSPAAACSPATSSFCYHHSYRHHRTSALAYLVASSLSLSRIHARVRATNIPSPFLVFPCIIYALSIFSSSRCYFQDPFHRSFSTFLSLSLTHARTHALVFAYTLSRARFYSFVSYEKFSKPNTQQFFYYYLLSSSFSLIFNSYVFVSFQRNAM